MNANRSVFPVKDADGKSCNPHGTASAEKHSSPNATEDIDESRQSNSDSEYSNQENEYEEDLVSEDQTVESSRFIAIGVIDDRCLLGNDEKKEQRLPHRQPRDLKPPPCTTADENVAMDIAREEHDTKMRIKKERESIGRLRPTVPITRTSNTRTPDGPRPEPFSQKSKLKSSAQYPSSSIRADRDREEKMRTFEARRRTTGKIVPRARPSREGNAASCSVPPQTGNTSPSAHTAQPRSYTRNARSRAEKIENEERKREMAKIDKKQTPPSSNSIQHDHLQTESLRRSSSNRTNDEMMESEDSTIVSQRSTSSGIDLDEKTRQRILSRSNLRRAKPRKSSTYSIGSRNTGVDTSLSTSVDRSRPSDDKRNLRITPKMPVSKRNTDLPSTIGSVTPGAARASRPSDEKAAFRRSRYPNIATASVSNSDSRVANAKETSECISLEEGVDVISSNDHRASYTASNDSDSEYGNDIDYEEQEILPGAFAVSGIGEDEVGQRASGYDSGFEDDASILSEMGNSNAVDDKDFRGEESSQQDSNNNLETVGTGGSIADVSSAVGTITPLQAELYEIEATVDAVKAEILIIEEDSKTTGKIVRKSVKVFLIVLGFVLVVVPIVGVLLQRYLGKENDTESLEGDSAPTIEGWKQVGGVLTVESFKEMENTEFGKGVAISDDGDRIAVGLPGSDSLTDDFLKNIGSVEIFDLINGTEWKLKSQIYGMYPNDELGKHIALSGDGKRLVVGSPSSGYVAIYGESNTTGQFEMVSNLTSVDNSTKEDSFGRFVGISGDGRVIAFNHQTTDDFVDVGAVNIYQEINGTWIQMGNRLYGSEKHAYFGWAIALSKSGYRIAVSSLGGNQNPGKVDMYDYNGTSWERVGSNPIEVRTLDEYNFGAFIDLSGDGSVVAASAPANNNGTVRAYRYNEEIEEWLAYGNELQGENMQDGFGNSLALSHDGNTLAISGPQNRNFCDYCGHIKVFRNTNGTWDIIGSELGLTGIDGGKFGSALALSASGSRLVGGAPSTIFNGFVSQVGQVVVFDSVINDTTSGM